MALPHEPARDREIVSRAFELALLMTRYEGDGWPPAPGKVRRFHLHTAVVELHYRIRQPSGQQSGTREDTYLTYAGRWGSWLGDIDAAGNLVHIAYQARGAAAEP